MTDTAIIELFFQRSEQAIGESRRAYGLSLYTRPAHLPVDAYWILWYKIKDSWRIES